MDDFIIYLLFKQLVLSIDSEYTVRFRDVKINKHNEVGIFVKGGEVDRATRLLDNAEYTKHYARVQVIIQSGDTENSIFKALRLKQILAKSITKACNVRYIVQAPLSVEDDVLIYDSNAENHDVEITLIRTDLLGEPDFKGYTSQGLARDIINFKIEYSIGG